MGRIVRAADFQRVLGTAPRARSRHFAVHHLRQSPTRGPGVPRQPDALPTGLSTDAEQACPHAVEDVPADAPLPQGAWLGLVVPKRNAKRSVTRSLVKRQMRAVMGAAVAARSMDWNPACGWFGCVADRSQAVSERGLRCPARGDARRAEVGGRAGRPAGSCLTTSLGWLQPLADAAAAGADRLRARVPAAAEPLAGQQLPLRADLLDLCHRGARATRRLCGAAGSPAIGCCAAIPGARRVSIRCRRMHRGCSATCSPP